MTASDDQRGMVAFEELHATWTAVPEPSRAAIHGALVAALDAELRRLDSFYPASPGGQPSIDVLGVVTDDAGTRRVHFIGHDLNYNHAQSGSDWADHYVLTGHVELDANHAPGRISLALAAHDSIREYDWDAYNARPVVERVRDALLATLGASPPLPELERVRCVRCPRCGATDAGAIEHLIELARMCCGVCGHCELCDDEEIKDEWNVEIERRKGEQHLPAFVPPLASDKPGFELRGSSGDDVRVVAHREHGYAIAIPGAPYAFGPTGTRSALLVAGVWVHIVVRAHSLYSELAVDQLVRRELEASARRRAAPSATLELRAAPVPAGATASMYVVYPRVVDGENTIELLALSLRSTPPNHEAVYVYATHPARRLDPFAAANLHAALLAHQCWQSGELPSRDVCPPRTVLVEPTLALRSTQRGSEAAEAKATQLRELTAEQARQIIDVLLAAARELRPPTAPWTTADADALTRAIAEIAGTELARSLLRDLSDVTSMHEFRGWCRLCRWAIDNRPPPAPDEPPDIVESGY